MATAQLGMLCVLLLAAAPAMMVAAQKPPTGGGSQPHVAAGMTEIDYALMEAVAEGELDEIKRLIKEGADVNSKNSEGETPLHVSGIWGKVEPLQLLLAAGAKVNVQATGAKSLGLAPLHWYTHPGYKDGVAALLKAGAAVNMVVKDEAGIELTALDIARRYTNSEPHAEVEQLLVKAGGKPRDELPGGKKSEL